MISFPSYAIQFELKISVTDPGMLRVDDCLFHLQSGLNMSCGTVKVHISPLCKTTKNLDKSESLSNCKPDACESGTSHVFLQIMILYFVTSNALTFPKLSVMKNKLFAYIMSKIVSDQSSDKGVLTYYSFKVIVYPFEILNSRTCNLVGYLISPYAGSYSIIEIQKVSRVPCFKNVFIYVTSPMSCTVCMFT